MAYQDDLLHAFLGTYGRMCGLVARALAQGHDFDAVTAAANGGGDNPAPVYVGIRRQRVESLVALRRVVDAHVSWLDIGHAVAQTRDAVEREWMLTLPRFAEAVSA